MRRDQTEQRFSCFGIVYLLDAAGEVEVIPTDDAVFDEPVAGLSDLLFARFGLGELAGIADGDGAGEAVRQFDLVELALDGLAQIEIIDIAQDKQRLDDLPEGLEGLVERVLARIGIQPPEDIGCGVLLEFDGGAGSDLIDGGAGGDILKGGSGVDTLGYAGSDAGVRVRLNPNANGNHHTAGGHAQDDQASGFENVIGSVHNDTLYGDAGDNRLEGGDGDDEIRGGNGDDTIMGGLGSDELYGGLGTDTILFADADARVVVDLENGVATTYRRGGAEADQLTDFENVGGSGFNDTLFGTGEANEIRGGAGNDRMNGRFGNDQLRGEAGNDILIGDQGADLLDGGIGDDLLIGGLHNDALYGSGGSDVFRFHAGHGNDVIADFTDGQDRLQMLGAGVERFDLLTIEDSGANTIIHYQGGQITLRNTDHTTITQDDFLFA